MYPVRTASQPHGHCPLGKRSTIATRPPKSIVRKGSSSLKPSSLPFHCPCHTIAKSFVPIISNWFRLLFDLPWLPQRGEQSGSLTTTTYELCRNFFLNVSNVKPIWPAGPFLRSFETGANGDREWESTSCLPSSTVARTSFTTSYLPWVIHLEFHI